MKKKTKQQPLQLDLFAGTDYAPLAAEISSVSCSADNVRRGVFARLDALSKRVAALEAERAVKVVQKRCEIINLWEHEA